MAEKTASPSAPLQEGFNEHVNRIASFNGEAMQAFAEACTAYADCVSGLNKEFMGFVSSRLNRDVELSQALAACKNWSEAVALQQRWAQEATHEYMEEAGRISALATKIAKESWEPITKRASGPYDETAKRKA